MPLHAHGLDQVVDRTRRDALDVGFLDHCGERFLGHAARLQEAREVGALPELGDAQLDGAGARLPVPVTIAVALGEPQRVLLAIGSAGGGPYLQLHQPFGGKADHLAQQIGVRGLLHEGAQAHHVVGHRWLLESGWCSQPDPTEESPVTREAARPLRRYEGARTGGFATAELHHHRGRDQAGSRISLRTGLCRRSISGSS